MLLLLLSILSLIKQIPALFDYLINIKESGVIIKNTAESHPIVEER